MYFYFFCSFYFGFRKLVVFFFFLLSDCRYSCYCGCPEYKYHYHLQDLVDGIVIYHFFKATCNSKSDLQSNNGRKLTQFKGYRNYRFTLIECIQSKHGFWCVDRLIIPSLCRRGHRNTGFCLLVLPSVRMLHLWTQLLGNCLTDFV